MSRLFELRHPFFLPQWRRIATVLFLCAWTAFEIASGSIFWTIVFGAITALCIYEFFVVFDPANFQPKDR